MLLNNELSYDDFHENEYRLFRLVKQRLLPNGEPDAYSVFDVLHPCETVGELKDQLHGVIRASAYSRAAGIEATFQGSTFNVDVASVHQDFLRMFTFPLLVGDVGSVLKKPDDVLVTEGLARRLTGASYKYGGIIGRSIQLRSRSLVIKGVLKKIPNTSSLSFELLGTPDLAPTLRLAREQGMWLSSIYIETDGGEVSQSLNSWSGKGQLGNDEFRLFLQPLSDVYLNGELPTVFEANGDASTAYLIFGISAILMFVSFRKDKRQRFGLGRRRFRSTNKWNGDTVSIENWCGFSRVCLREVWS